MVPDATREPRGWAEACREAGEVLREGGLLVHPTSTVYGIGGAATAEVDAEVSRIKGRPASWSLIRLAADIRTLRASVEGAVWSASADALAREFWPGPLTLVLDDGSAAGIAVRVDGHPFARAVAAALGGLMSSTSLNLSGRPPTADPAVARRTLGTMPKGHARVLFTDAGPLPSRGSSTIVSLREEVPRLIREGAVTAAQIESCLGTAVVAGAVDAVRDDGTRPPEGGGAR